jgi:hypothetical protein
MSADGRQKADLVCGPSGPEADPSGGHDLYRGQERHAWREDQDADR